MPVKEYTDDSCGDVRSGHLKEKQNAWNKFNHGSFEHRVSWNNRSTLVMDDVDIFLCFCV